MPEEDAPGFLCHFDTLEDPRIDRKKLYPLTEILFVVICASICGAQSWRDFVTFGEEKLDYLRRFLPFENGIPSKLSRTVFIGYWTLHYVKMILEYAKIMLLKIWRWFGILF